MKKLLIISIFSLGLQTNLLAQVANDSLRVRALTDSIAQLYARYLELGSQNQELKDELAKAISNLDARYQFIENQAQGNTEQIKQITTEDRRTVQTVYEKNRLSIVTTANFMDAVNQGLNALEFSVSSLDYSNSIFELNNPTNTELGFSLDKVILRVVDDKIIRGKFGKKFGSKLRNIISGIINNPIVNNPITKAVFSTVPAVSSISSVYNVINTLGVQEPDINAVALNAFNKEMQKYVAHYEALAKASRDLEFNLNNLKLKAESVRKLAENFVKEAVEDLYDTSLLPNLQEMDMNGIVNSFYNYANVSQYIQGLERKHLNDYRYLSQRLVFPVVGRSKASFISEEVEKLYNEYVTTLSNYHESVLLVLDNATKLSDDPQKVTIKINDLNQRYKKLIAAYEKSVNIRNIRALEDTIPRF